MYVLLHTISKSELFQKQFPVFIIAFLIAEFFYKFHSFALECLAFLATWYVLDAISDRLFGFAKRRAKQSISDPK